MTNERDDCGDNDERDEKPRGGLRLVPAPLTASKPSDDDELREMIRQVQHPTRRREAKRMSQQTQYKLRSLTAADQSLLWEMLYLSLFVPEGKPPFKRSVLEHPDLAKYVRDWGRADDSGFVVVDENNQPLGAVWLRLFAGEEIGYGYVDDFTPELAIAILPEYRGQGIGASLLTRLVETAAASYEQISLSVAAGNPAVRLYQRLGFEIVAAVGDSLTMRKRLKARE